MAPTAGCVYREGRGSAWGRDAPLAAGLAALDERGELRRRCGAVDLRRQVQRASRGRHNKHRSSARALHGRHGRRRGCRGLVVLKKKRSPPARAAPDCSQQQCQRAPLTQSWKRATKRPAHSAGGRRP